MSILQILNSSWDDTKKIKENEEEMLRKNKEKNFLPLNSMLFFYNEDNND